MIQFFKDVFVMPLFPHIYAIPVSMLFGVAFGYYLRGKIETETGEGPASIPKPNLD